MSNAYAAKGMAKQFLHKLFDGSDSDARPPKPPPKPTHYGTDQLAQRFEQLNLSPNLPRPPQNHFIGGFDPSKFGANPLPPRPPSMPMPVPNTSLTMQHALRAEPPTFLNLPPPPGSRPHSLPPPTHAPPHGTDSPFLSPLPSPSTSPSVSTSAGTPTKSKPRPRRSNSAPTVATCAGFTKAGKRCTREVKSRGPAFAYRLTGDDVDMDVDGNAGSEGAVERYCYQHIKDFIGGTGSATGFYARRWMGEGKDRGDEVWVSFADYIPPYLSPETQVALRVEMEKPRSPKDTEGYIYTFEIRNPSSPQIELKTGRTTHLVRRLGQWGKQCSSKEQVLRGWYPGGVDPATGLPSSLMKGRVDAGSKGAACHRLERLIHLELADLVAEGQYLNPTWRSFKVGDTPASASTPTSPPSTPNKKPAAASLGSGPKCPDCGAQHKEIFTFTRVKKGVYKGKEWEGIVKPVVERWGQFVEEHVG